MPAKNISTTTRKPRTDETPAGLLAPEKPATLVHYLRHEKAMASGAGYGIGDGTAVDADAGAVQSGSRVYPPRNPYKQIPFILLIEGRFRFIWEKI